MADVNISKFRAQVVRDGSKPATPGFVVSEGQSPTDPAGSGQNHLPVTIAEASTGLSITESQVLGGAGTVAQYIRGDGSLADFPATTGGGSSVSYYLNSSVSQGTIGGVAYREVNRNPVFGAGTDIATSSNGYIANFITDAGDPNKLLIPAGNWNLETYFSANSGGGSPTFYVELYKYNGTTFTLIATSSGTPELIAFGTNINPYFTTLAVPETVLALTDRLALRYYVNTSGRTITLHTEDNHLCQVITTFTTGLTALNGLTSQVQFFAVGTSGTDFAISSATDTHTFNLPTASATNRGALSSSDWSTFNGKQPAGNYVTTDTVQSITAQKTFANNTLTLSTIFNANNTILTNSGGASTYQSGTNFFGFNTDNHIYFAKSSNTGANTGILAWSNTATRTYTLKDASGTLAFTSDIPANPVGGTGTTNYLPKFTGATTIGNSQVFDNGTNVGIGTATPNDKFHVVGGIYSTSLTTPINTNIGAIQIGYDGTNGVIRTWNSSPLIITNYNYQAFETSGSERFRISSTGYVSAGAVTNGRLGVRGFTNDSSGYAFEAANSSGNTLFIVRNDGVSTFTGNVGIGTYSPADKLHVANNGTNAYSAALWTNSNSTANLYVGVGGSGVANTGLQNNAYVLNAAASALVLGTSDTERMRITSGGNVLIGTTTDAGYKLDVSGTLRSTGRALLGNSMFVGEVSGSYSIIETTGSNGIWLRPAGVSSPSGMFLTSGGNVGIGTSSPGSPLHVVNSSNGFIYRFAGGTSSAITGGIFAEIGRNFASIGTTSNHGFNIFTNDLDRLAITSGGNVLIGTTTDSGARLYVTGGLVSTMLSLRSNNGLSTNLNFTSESPGGGSDNYTINHTIVHGSGGGYRIEHNVTSRWIRMIAGTGGVELSGGATSWASISDLRLKNIIGNLENSLDSINSLSAIKYTLKTDLTNKQRVGLIAQEVQKVLPECVEVDEKGILSVRYTELIPLLVSAIKELNEKIK
jgi:hypothetical protein